MSITTNGSLLKPYIKDLKKIGISSINLSLDSFNANTFKELTKSDSFENVVGNMYRALENNLKIKINVVAIRGITDIELKKYLSIIQEFPIELRFIEFMPLGTDTKWKPSLFLSAKEIISEIEKFISIFPFDRNKDSPGISYAGPAQLYAIPNYRGKLGFISAMSNHFCSSCNRLRVTANGSLRTCLFSPKEFHLKALLQNKNIEDEKIAQVLKIICRSKPVGHELLQKRKTLPIIANSLVSIGG